MRASSSAVLPVHTKDVDGPASGSGRDATWPELWWRMYQAQLRRRPLRTKALTSAVIFSASDVISQHLGEQPFSLPRNLLVALWGLVWGGPSAHFWMGFMQRLSPKTDMATVLTKVLIDQTTYGPVNNLINMAFFTLLVENKGLQHLIDKIWHQYPRVQLNGWRLWPAASMFNYRFVPLPYRVLFLNVVALGWTTFLNFSATHKIKTS